MSEHFPGPPELGRGLVIAGGSPLPSDWSAVPRVRVDESALAEPAQAVAALHEAWVNRRRVVVELAVSVEQLRQTQQTTIAPYLLQPSFEFARERLRFLVWANNYDGTRDVDAPIWWHGRLAQRLGAPPHSLADVDLDGPTWVDGGPRADLPFPVLHRESVELKRLVKTLPSLTREISGLAPDQRAAVLHRGSSARILAPAGSGKTRVLTERCAYLLECGFEPQRVTALAYNRRAARQMQERLGARRCQIRTLHALGFSLLRKHREVRLASEGELRALLGPLVKAKPLLNQDPLQPYFEALQLARLGLVHPLDVEQNSEEIPGFADIFDVYRSRLRERGWVDHDEQIYGTLELLLGDPGARQEVQRACTHLLVDEFQDLTPAFLLFIRLISAPSYQVFGVGDDDQVIYGYAGATPEYLLQFADYFPGAKPYALEVNYRCPAGIVQVASRLLSHNRLRVPKSIRCGSAPLEDPYDGLPQVILAPTADWLKTALAHLRDWLEQVSPQQIAVLARVNSLLLPMQVGLRQLGLAHQATVDATILRRTGLRSALAYLRLALYPKSMKPTDLNEALRRPNRKLRKEIVADACRCRNLVELERFSAKLDAWPASQIKAFLEDLSLLSMRLQQGLPDFFKCLRTQTEFVTAIDQLDAHGLGASSSSHRDDVLALEQTAGLYQGPSVDFEDWLNEILTPSPDADADEEKDGIRLSTVHRVKGLEWDFVMLFGVNEGIFPHHLATDLEEERRIFHVAMTRARRHCLMLVDPQRPSSFLKEMQPPRPAPEARKKKKKKKKR